MPVILVYMQQNSPLPISYLCSPRTLRSKKQQSSSSSLSLSLSQVNTPRKTLSFSAANTPINNNNSSSSVIQETNTASDASLLTSIVDQSHLRQRTITTTTTSTSVDGHWGQLLKMWIPKMCKMLIENLLIQFHHAGYTTFKFSFWKRVNSFYFKVLFIQLVILGCLWHHLKGLLSAVKSSPPTVFEWFIWPLSQSKFHSFRFSLGSLL